MVNINKWIGYISISIVMVVGILFVTGMAGAFNPKMRIWVGLACLVYVILRIIFIIMVRGKTRQPRGFSLHENVEEGDKSNPNNA